MGTELKDTFVQAYNDTYDYINCYLTSKLLMFDKQNPKN